MVGKKVMVWKEGTDYHAPEAILRTNGVCTTIYKGNVYFSSNIAFQLCPEENIFIKQVNGTNSHNKSRTPEYELVLREVRVEE